MRFALAAFLYAAVNVARADEGELAPVPRVVAQPAELLPVPQGVIEADMLLPRPAPIVELGPMGPSLPGYWRKSQYARWQLMAVDYQGYWKPRVVLAPQPYYLFNGMPYPWLSTRPTDLVPGRNY